MSQFQPSAFPLAYIEFQFCSFPSFMGRVIDWGTQGDVGHVDLVLPPWHPQAGALLGAQHEDGLGSQPAGVQIRPTDYGKTCKMRGRKRVALPTSGACAQAAYYWALSQLGTPYDTALIESILIGGTAWNAGHLICSGLASGALTQAQPSFIGHQFERPWRAITPAQLLLICNAFAPIQALAEYTDGGE